MNLPAGMPEHKKAEVETDIISIKALLSDQSLCLPIYQRPYKWSVQNVSQLLSDIKQQMANPPYRLGTIVFHRKDDKKNIVDGQQRIVTLMLFIHALSQCKSSSGVHAELKASVGAMTPLIFENRVSQSNIQRNYQYITREISRSEYAGDFVEFLLNGCEVVCITLHDLSEAFQFFDAQNARGRDLEPHDLLKAYHLREFSVEEEDKKRDLVGQWENSDSKELTRLFAEYLYRIRQWGRGESARYFSKTDIGLFKGVNMNQVVKYPYIKSLRIVHDSSDQLGDAFPYQLDQVIINGRRFFEMINHYQSQGFHHNSSGFIEEKNKQGLLDGFAPEIVQALNNYDGKHRSGDRYVRAMFDCLLMYYYDRFGEFELSRAIEKAFVWAYSVRLNMKSVYLATVDNYVVNKENNLFSVIKNAYSPDEFLLFPLPVLNKVKSSKTEILERLFRNMGYPHEQ